MTPAGPAAPAGMTLMTRSLLFALLSTASLLSFGVAHAKGDKAAGKTLVYTCAGCHGVPGYENAYPNYRVPRIAGQNEQYLITALHEYKSGDRKHPTMNAQAQSLSDQDIADIAAYLSSITKQ
jgi:cytochrome c553